MALLTAEALWLVVALVSPPGWGFIAAYLLHFLPLVAAVVLCVPILRTHDRRRWAHTGMVVAAADFFSLAFGAVVVLFGGSVFWRIMSGLGLVAWACVLVAFLLFLRTLAKTRQRNFGENLDAVIVLGAGLVGDRPGPLLARRVDRGIDAASQGLTVIMTGGQGPDEPVSEAWAMAMYAREHHGHTLEDNRLQLLEEDRATNTRENLRFSIRQLWEGRSGGVEQKRDGAEKETRTRVGVVTSDFHVPRTEMTARTVAELLAHDAQHGDVHEARVGQGHVEFTVIGAETPGAARPAAYIREFVALTLWKVRGLL